MNNIRGVLKTNFLKFTFVFLIICLLCYQSLSIGKFCYSENKFLSKQEIIDRYLLGPDWIFMTPEQRTAKLLKYKDVRLECCYVDEEYDQSVWDVVLNTLIFWKSYYSIEAYVLKSAPPEADAPYYHEFGLIDSCGYGVPDAFGEYISASDYSNALSHVKRYRKDHGYAD